MRFPQKERLPCLLAGREPLFHPSYCLLDDPFDLAAVDAQFTRDRPLAAACLMSRSYRLLQCWRIGWRSRYRVLQDRRMWARGALDGRFGGGSLHWSDDEHAQFVGADQCHGRPCADQGADRAVSQAVRQVGADSGDDADAKAPAGQGWYGLGTPVGVEDDHRRRPDEAIDCERHQARRGAGLTVCADQLVLLTELRRLRSVCRPVVLSLGR